MKTLSKKLNEKVQKHFIEKFGKKLQVEPLAKIEDFLINKTSILFRVIDNNFDYKYIKVCIYDNETLSVRYNNFEDILSRIL